MPFHFVVLDQIQDSLLFMDASQEGWGMFFQDYYWVYGKWSKQLTTEDSIALAELLTLLIGLDLFASRFEGAYILVHIDNQNARSWVNN